MQNQKEQITMRDIAKRAHVSVATVSRVINNDPSVKESTRKIVENVLQEVNYKINPTRAGKLKYNQRIGLVIPEITNPYFSLLIRGISNAARIQNLEIILCNSDKDPHAEDEHLKRLLKNNISGIIYIPFTEQVNPLILDLIKKKFPLVFLDRDINRNDICSVTSDNEEGAYQAITYLLNLGHRNIVYIEGPPYYSTTINRTAGYRRGLEEAGLNYDESMVLRSDTTFENAYKEMIYFLNHSFSFSAIFASNDLMAIGAWKAVEEKGMQVPEDVSIIGYDDVFISSIMSLTTIAQPGYEAGRNALMLLFDLITEKREPPQKILLRDSLIIRKSCKRV